MNIIDVDIDKLVPYENNAKIHTTEQIEQIAKSITLTKGLRQPIVIDSNNVIVCGHGRYQAAKKLGYKVVPCELVDDLTEDEIKAYRLIDNRISEGEYDITLEQLEIDSIEIDLGEFGIEIPESFSIDDMEEIEGYDSENDDREYFEKTFTFPIEKKKRITNYLKKHIAELTEMIILNSDKEYEDDAN